MCRRVLTAILILVLATGASGCNGGSARRHGVVAGFVTDEATGHPLPDVWVTSGSAAAWTNDLGRYWLSLPQGLRSISFRCAGYTAMTLCVSVVGHATISTDLAMNPLPPTENTM